MANWEDVKKQRQAALQANTEPVKDAGVSDWEREKIKRGMEKDPEVSKIHFNPEDIATINFDSLPASKSTSTSPISVAPEIIQKVKADRYKTPDVTGKSDFEKFSQVGADKTTFKIAGLDASFGLTKFGSYSHNMTDEEKAIYNYWIGKGNKSNAKKYLNSIIPTINQRTAEKDSETIKNMTDRNPAAGVFYDIGSNLLAPVGLASTAKAAITGEDIDTNSNAFFPARAMNTVENELFKDATPLESFLGQTGLSMAKFATALPLGEVGALTILSSGAAGNAAYDATKRGASTDEALAVGTLTGITEYLTEKIPLHNLLKLAKGNVNLLTKEGVKQVLKQAGIEGTEEVVSQYANALSDIAVMGNRSQYTLYKQQLIDQGMSPEEAEQKTNTEFFITQPALAFAGGVMSGGVFGSGAAGIATYKMNKTGSTMRGLGIEQDVIDTGLESDPKTNSFKEATRVADIMRNGGKVSNADIGGLYYANVEAINAENDEAQRQGIRSMLIQNGVTVSESDKISSVMQKAFAGDPLSNTEAESIVKNDSARNVFSSVTGYDIPLGTMSEMRKSVKQFSEDVVSGKAESIYVEPKNEPQTNEMAGAGITAQTNQKPAAVAAPAVPAVQAQKEYSRDEMKSSVSKLGKSGQKSFGINFQGRNDLEDYSKAFSAYYIAGRTGLPSEEVDKSYSQYKDVLTPVVKFSAYSAGQNDAKTETAEKVKTAASMKSFDKKESGIKDSKEIDKSVAKAMDVMGKATGTKIEIVDSIEVGGNKGAANGFYKNGTIKIARDADNPILVVAKHEVTHRLKDVSPKEYEEYKNHVINVMTKNGSLEKNVQRLDNLYKRNGQNLSYDEILDEIAADFTENIMTDQSAFIDLAVSNRNIAQKVLDIFREFIQMIKSAFEKTDNNIRNTLGFNLDDLKKTEAMWTQALKAAEQKTVTLAGNLAVEEEFITDEGIKFSLRTQDPPEKTLTAYKLFEQGENGKLYTLYIDRGEAYPVGKWIDAEVGNNNKTPLGKLSFRPALHCAAIPFVNHIGNRDENGNIAYTKPNHVWAEVEIAADKNYQKEADKLGRTNQPNLGRVPENGYYRFPNATRYPEGSAVPKESARWFLTGSMKINRILSDEEVNQILKPYNLTMLPRKEASASKDKERFSLKKPVESTKDLIALHNLSMEQLKETAKLGGFPMPSIAVMKSDMLHDRYGDVTIVFGRDTIDPETDRRNEVFGGDAWTASFPAVGYKLDEKIIKNVENKVKEIAERAGFERSLYPSVDENNMSDKIGTRGISPSDAYFWDDKMRAVYFAETTPEALPDGNYYNVMDTVRDKFNDEGVQTEYREWLDNIFDGLILKRGIRNTKEWFTYSGNRRSFDQLYDEYTLENIVKAMAAQAKKGADSFLGGPGAIIGVSSKEYKGVDEIRKDKGRLRHVDETEMAEAKQDIENRLIAVIGSMIEGSNRSNNKFILMDDASEAIIAAIRKSKNPSVILRSLKEWYGFNSTIEIAQEIADIAKDAANIPTEYFEAKPRRAVGIEEIRAIVLPEDETNETTAWFEEKGITLYKYQKDNSQSRIDAVNSVQDVRFSLKDSEGHALTEDQADYFKSSKVRDESGNLRVMYHGTKVFTGKNHINDPIDFSVFNRNSHFGTMKQAEAFAIPEETVMTTYKYREVIRGTKNERVYPVYLNILKPKRIKDAGNDWGSDIDKARQQGYDGIVYLNRFENVTDKSGTPLSKRRMQEMAIDYNKKNDGVARFGALESLTDKEFLTIFNAEDSYIAFRPEQVKSILNEHPTLHQDIRYSLKDSEGNNLSDNQIKYFMDSKVRNEEGSLLVMYHGTPYGGFTEFNNGSYFTQHKEWADVYQTPSASSLRGRYDPATDEKTYKVYLNIKKPFDTRNEKERRIFENEYYRQWGTGTPLMESGLPDWVDGMDIQEFIEEMGYDYDGIILDEGGTGGYGDEIKSRGVSYVVFNSNQVKNISNQSPTENSDIRYSFKEAMKNIVSRIEEGKIDFDKPQGLYTTPAEFKNPHAEIDGETHYYKIKEEANFYDVNFTGKLKTDRMRFPVESGASLNYLVDILGKNEVERLANMPKDKLILMISQKYSNINWNRYYDKHEILEGYGGLLARENGIDVIRQYVPGDDFSETIILKRDVADEIENPYGRRYSLKGETNILKENAMLKEMNEQLKTQFKQTSKVKINQKKTESYAKGILKEYSSAYDKTKLFSEISSLYNEMSGETVDYETVKRAARDTAFKVLDSSSVVNNELYQDYRDLIKRTREVPLRVNDLDKTEISYIVGDYNEFRKKNFGTMKLVNEDYGSGLTVDEYYQSLVEMHPELFDEEIANQGEQLVAIRDVIKSLKPFEENPYSDYMDEAVEFLTYDILDQFFEIPQNRPTFADRQERKLTMAKIKAGEALRTERARRIEQIAKLKEQYRNKEHKKSKSVADRNMRIRIERLINELSQKLMNPTDKQHVPDALKRPVAEFLKSIDFSTSRQMYGTRNKIAGLQNAYLRIAAGIDQGDSDFYLDIDPDFINVISELSDTIGDKRVIDMSSEELRKLYQVARMVKATIYNYNKLLSDDLRQDVFFKGESVIEELRTGKAKNESGYELINEIDKLVKFDMLAPSDFFETLGTNMTDLYNNIRRGLDKKIKNTKIVTDYMTNLLDGHDISDWTGNKAKSKTYELSNKKSIELTPAQVMSLYLLSKREQAKDHIYIGGIKHAPVTKRIKGKIIITKAFEPAHVKEVDVANIISTLTPEQRKIADGISEFLNTYTSDWGNEISMKLYGYRKFTEKNYFPIKSDDNYLVSEFGIYTDPSLKGKGWTKATMRKANNPIIIDDIFDVFTKMADESSSYNAFVIPLSDVQKVVNYRGAVGSVKQSIEKNFGKDAIKYLSKLIIDINGGLRTEVGNQLLNKLLTRYKAAAMGFNPRVVIQQPTSLVRSMAMIDPKYMAMGIAKKGDWDKVVQYSPIAQWKAWGYFNMDIGRQLKDIFIGEKNWKDSLFFFGGIQAADNMAWSKLWNAVEYEIKDSRPDLAEGTPLFYEAVGRRFSEIVDKTMVVDTVLHRTQIMRSNDTLMKVYTSFMAEPMKSYNLLKSSIRKAIITKDPEDKKKAIRTVLAWAAAVAVNSLAVSLIDFYRNSEDEDKFVEYYIESFLGNAINDITGMFPYVKDVASMANGYSPKKMELDGLNDAVKAIKKFGDYATAIAKGEQPKYTGAFVMKDVVTSASKLLGIPIYNVKREIGAFLKNYIRWTNSNELDYSIEKIFNNINNSDNRSVFMGILYKAVQDGDKDAAKRIYNDMLINGIPKAYIEQGLRSRVRKTLAGTNEITVMSEAVQKWQNTPEDQRTDEMKSSIKSEFDANYKALLEMGYSDKEIQKAIEKNRAPESVPTMKDLLKAYEAGISDESKQAEFYEMCNRMIDAGYDKEDIAAAIEAHNGK